jgi:hypothetical protein
VLFLYTRLHIHNLPATIKESSVGIRSNACCGGPPSIGVCRVQRIVAWEWRLELEELHPVLCYNGQDTLSLVYFDGFSNSSPVPAFSIVVRLTKHLTAQLRSQVVN